MNPSDAWPTFEGLSLTDETITDALGEDRLVRVLTPTPKHCDELFLNSVDTHPQSDAVIDNTERLSYLELNARVDAISSALVKQGVSAGDRLAILFNNHNDFVAILLACWRAKIIAVPINVRLQAPEIAYIINHCQARAVVVDDDVVKRLPANNEIPSVEEIWQRTIDPTHRVQGIQSFDALTGSTQPTHAVDISADDTALILYTSGTTGYPKGAMLSHRTLVQSTAQYRVCQRLTKGERSVMAVPASHVTGLTANILSMLAVAGAIVILPRFDVVDFLTLAARERMTHTVMVPAMYNLCLLRAQLTDYDLSHWRVGGYGGAPMPEATIDALANELPGLSIANIYGATETAGPCTMMPFGHTHGRSDSVGRAMPCVDFKVVDAAGNEVSINQTGELWIRAPGVTTGYWDDPAATRSAISDGWWHSGDIASIDDDGYVRIVDRLKDMINRGGYKIYSIEVENALNFHPDVVESAVVAVNDPVLGEKTFAFIYTENPDLTERHLREHCLTCLAQYKQPDFYSLRAQPLARNANGKLLKRQLRDDAMSDLPPHKSA